MEFLVPLGSIILLLGFVVVIGYPLFRPPRADGGDPGRKRLVERREHLYAAIRELDFDRQTGKLPEGDHQSLRRPLESEALDVLHQLEGGNGDVDEGQRRRVEEEIHALRRSPQAVCPSCGSDYRPSDRFCAQCGSSLQEHSQQDKA